MIVDWPTELRFGHFTGPNPNLVAFDSRRRGAPTNLVHAGLERSEEPGTEDHVLHVTLPHRRMVPRPIRSHSADVYLGSDCPRGCVYN